MEEIEGDETGLRGANAVLGCLNAIASKRPNFSLDRGVTLEIVEGGASPKDGLPLEPFPDWLELLNGSSTASNKLKNINVTKALDWLLPICLVLWGI
jgi:hypothetical protein